MKKGLLKRDVVTHIEVHDLPGELSGPTLRLEALYCLDARDALAELIVEMVWVLAEA